MSIALACLVAAAVTVALIERLRGVAVRIELADFPGERKGHAGPVPLVGGLAMYFGFALAALLLDHGLGEYRAFFAAGAVLVVTGVLDDLRELSSRARFASQIVAALFMVHWGNVGLADLGALGADGAPFELGVWRVPLTVFATVGVINALNMVDGLDGLAGGLALVPLVGLLAVAGASGQVEEAGLLAVLTTVLVVFLCFNVRLGRPQALVFMGDAGSMMLGFAITWFVIDLSQGAAPAMPPVLALWLLVVPLFDTVWLLIWRPLNGRWPTSPDLQHLHHALQMAGLGPRGTLLVALTLSLAGAVVGVAGWRAGWSERALFHAFLGAFAVYCVVMAVTWRTGWLLLWRLDRRLIADRRAGRERRVADRRRAEDRRAGGDRRD